MDPLRVGDPERVGPYRLSAGGMGQVFLGQSPGRRPVAVKLVRPELADDQRFRERFASEVAAARRVGGFYTAQVVDADSASVHISFNPLHPWAKGAAVGIPGVASDWWYPAIVGIGAAVLIVVAVLMPLFSGPEGRTTREVLHGASWLWAATALAVYAITQAHQSLAPDKS